MWHILTSIFNVPSIKQAGLGLHDLHLKSLSLLKSVIILFHLSKHIGKGYMTCSCDNVWFALSLRDEWIYLVVVYSAPYSYEDGVKSGAVEKGVFVPECGAYYHTRVVHLNANRSSDPYDTETESDFLAWKNVAETLFYHFWS